jgi:hypothetical protein
MGRSAAALQLKKHLPACPFHPPAACHPLPTPLHNRTPSKPQIAVDDNDINAAKNFKGDVEGSAAVVADVVAETSLSPYSEVFGLQRFRETELIHGRWAMLGVLGALVAEGVTGQSWCAAAGAPRGRASLAGAGPPSSPQPARPSAHALARRHAPPPKTQARRRQGRARRGAVCELRPALDHLHRRRRQQRAHGRRRDLPQHAARP